jgi:hypothetical protein
MLPVLHQCLHGLEISRNVIKLKAVLFEGGGAWWATLADVYPAQTALQPLV